MIVRADFGFQKATTITAEQIDKYIEQRLADGYAAASINRTLQLLNQCYSAQAPEGFFEAAEFNAVLENVPEYLKDFCREWTRPVCSD